MRELLAFCSLPRVQLPSCFHSSSFSFIFSFILPGYLGIFLVLLGVGVQGLLLVFGRCSVRVVPFADVFLMHLWGEMNSTASSYSDILETPILYFLIQEQTVSILQRLQYGKSIAISGQIFAEVKWASFTCFTIFTDYFVAYALA